MADASYDVVMVGGGNKGLIAAMYLTKYGGMSVGIFEEKHELGGGWCTEESPAPGFLANHHAHNLSDRFGPVYEDFPEWIEYGVRHIVKPVSFTVCFPDGTWCGFYSMKEDPTQEKSAEMFARFSERDAETWLWLYDKVKRYIEPAMLEWYFNPAQPLGIPDAVDRLIMNPESGIDLHWRTMTYIQVLQELFESVEVQLAFARSMLSIGNFPDAYGGGLGVPLSFWGGLTAGTVPGGTHTLAHASQRVILENGGKAFTRKLVEKILIENGVAKGIRLADGTEVEAKKAVLSGVDPYQLVVELVGEEHWDPGIVGKIKRLERGFNTLTWYTWALHERPRYIAEAFNPDLPYAVWVGLVASRETGIEDIMDETYRRRLGLWPDMTRPTINVGDHSILVPGYAPPGKASVVTEQWVLPAWRLSEAEWKKMEKQHAEDVLSFWQKFAPNMTWDNVIGYVPITPYYTSRDLRNFSWQHGNHAVIDTSPPQTGRFRPIPELASGRMPIKNLYATGAGWHPFPGAHPAQGYNIYKIMAEDFGLRKPWEEKSRPY